MYVLFQRSRLNVVAFRDICAKKANPLYMVKCCTLTHSSGNIMLFGTL